MSVYETGMDASRYQGKINWPEVAAAGKQFALLRIGSSNRQGTYVDPYFLKNVSGAHSAGLKVGAYYYTYARNQEQVAAELETFLSVLQGLRLEYPVFVDVEDASLQNLGRARLTELVEYAMNILDQRSWYPGYYTYTAFAERNLDLGRLAAYPLWIADYRGYVGVGRPYELWQYSASGRIKGVQGPMDLNYSYKDFLPILKEGGYNGYGPDGPVMGPIEGKDLEVYGTRCEYFYTANVNDVVGYLPLGRYPAQEISREEYQGFTWVKFRERGQQYWTVLLEDRCRLVDARDECKKELALERDKIKNTRVLLEEAIVELDRKA